MNFPHLLYNEVRLQYFEMRQYWFETVTSMVLVLGIFAGLFFGVKSMVPGMEEQQSLDGLVFGFLLWSFAAGAYQSVTKSIVDDTQKGYSEQLFIAPMSFVNLMLVRAVAELLVGYLYLMIFAYAVMWMTSNWIDINFAMLFLLLMLAAPSLVGLGLVVSGLALLFKKVETVGMMLSLAFMGLVALDGLPINVFTFLPFVPGASLARDIILDQHAFNWYHFGIVLLNSGIYLSVGIWAFKKLETKAKRKNLIGRY